MGRLDEPIVFFYVSIHLDSGSSRQEQTRSVIRLEGKDRIRNDPGQQLGKQRKV